jgi:hypothetical protein
MLMGKATNADAGTCDAVPPMLGSIPVCRLVESMNPYVKGITRPL